MMPILEFPQALFVNIPFALMLIFLYNKQLKALSWIQRKVSPRFQKDLSVFTPNTLKIQFIIYFIMGLLLSIAIANPVQEDKQEIEVKDKGTIIFVIDGSLSMLAGDTTMNPITNLKPYDRFGTAQDFASDIVDMFPDYKYGLLTFSGETSVHSMPIQNPIEIKKLIRTALVHNFENTGISFLNMFKELHHISEMLGETYQVILISDGEQLEQQKEDLWEELEVFAARGIVFHTIGVGTKSPGGSIVFSIVYYDNEKGDENSSSKSDKALYKKKESSRKSVITRATYRQDIILQTIANETKGQYLVVEHGDWVGKLKDFIKEIKSKTTSKKISSGKASLAYYPLTAFLFLLLGNSFLFFQKSPVGVWKKVKESIPFIGSKLLILFVCLISLERCSEQNMPALLKAHKYNELGKEAFQKKEMEDARLNFTKSISFGFKQHIPTYNLGKVYFAERDFPTAHEKFQKAMLLNKDFTDAIYLDGITLYEWGVSELSPEICDVARAKTLWEQSIVRFEEAVQSSGMFDKTSGYKKNIEYIREEITRLEQEGEDFCQKKTNEKKQEEEEKQKQEKDSDQKEKSENQEQKDEKDSQQDKGNQDQSGKDDKDEKDSKSGKDGKDEKDSKSGKDGKDEKDSKSGKDGKDEKDSKSGKDGKNEKDSKSGKDGKDEKDSKSGKDGKDEKDSKSGKDGMSSDDSEKSPEDSKGGGETNRQKKKKGNAIDTLEKREAEKPKLTEEEKKELDSALDRLSNKEYKPKLHKRTRHEQSSKNRDTKELKKMLEEAYW